MLLAENELIPVEVGVKDYLSTACGGCVVLLFKFVIAVLTSNLVMHDAGVEMLQSNLFGDGAGQFHGRSYDVYQLLYDDYTMRQTAIACLNRYP